MRPVLFELNLLGHCVTVMSYTFFLVLAAVAMVWLGAAIARKRGLDGRKSAACLLAGLVATAIGARLVHWATNPGSFDGLGAVVSLGRSNLSVYAGLLFGIPAVALASWRLRVDGRRLADAAAPAIALAAALARVGCFLNGCCFGKPTGAAWGIDCPSSEVHLSQITSGAIGLFDAPLPVHPTQLYEAAAAIIGGLIALWVMRRKRPAGQAFAAFALWFTSLRWVNHYFLLAPASFVAPQWLYPAIYAVAIAMCCLLLTRKRGLAPLD